MATVTGMADASADAADSIGRQERCIKLPVLSVDKSVKSHSSLQRESLFTAGNVLRSASQGIENEG